METLRKEISNLMSDRTAAIITSSIFCFSAGILVCHWSRRLYSALKARRVRADRTGLNSTANGSIGLAYDKRIASRSQLTAAEHRLAKEAANELLRVLDKYKRDVRQRNGSRVSRPGGETGTGFGERDLYIRERDQRVHGKEDVDNTF